MRNIFVAVAGTTPQVISETIWSLARQADPPIRLSEIHIATTTRGREAIEPLFGAGGVVSRLLEDGEGNRIATHHFHVFSDDGGEELGDIRTGSDSKSFASGLAELIRRLALDPDSRIFASIAGGRKTMSVLLAQAMTLFARPQDKLTHVLVSPEFEGAPDFWHPTDESVQLATGDGAVLDASNAIVELAELPFVRLRDCLSARELRSLVRDPESLVKQAQQELGARRHTAHVIFEVEGVSSETGPRQPDKRWLLFETLRTLPDNASLTMRAEVTPKDPGRIRLYLDCTGHGNSVEAAGRQAERIAASVRQALDFRRYGYQLSFAQPPTGNRQFTQVTTLIPTGYSLWASEERRLSGVDTDPEYLCVKVGGKYNGLLGRNLPLGLLAGNGGDISLAWTITPTRLDPAADGIIDAALEKLFEPTITATGEARYDKQTTFSAAQAYQLASELKAWKHERRGIAAEVTISSSAPIPDSVLEEFGIRVWGGRPFEAVQTIQSPSADGSLLNLASSFTLLERAPFDMPLRGVLQEAGIPTTWSPAPRSFRASGAVIATSQGQDIRLSEQDRARHLYVLGSTGTGKSTLLFNLIRQDIKNGAGVFVLDPHGDLVSALTDVIPAERADDLVFLDAGDPEGAFSIDLLAKEANGNTTPASFVSNEMISMVKRLYADNLDAFGPMFELYFRVALSAIMNTTAIAAPTLVDFVKFFSDTRYRRRVIAACEDKQITEQHKIVATADGEASWENISPYIVSKLNRFTLDPTMRRLTCRPNHSVDFSSLIANQRITMVRLPKGNVDEMNVRMLGMIITSKLFGAALGREIAEEKERTPTHVYIDEFQNFTTDSVSQILAEGRKFGIRLTLANQNLAQIDTRSREAVLGNAANLMAFRTGPADASFLTPYFEPALTRNDLQALPNFHAAMRILNDGAPVLPAFVAQTLPPEKPDYPCADTAAMIEASHSRFISASKIREQAANIAGATKETDPGANPCEADSKPTVGDDST